MSQIVLESVWTRRSDWEPLRVYGWSAAVSGPWAGWSPSPETALASDGSTHTPCADPMQAGSAAAVPFIVTELLGLHADGFAERLHTCRAVTARWGGRAGAAWPACGRQHTSLLFTRKRDAVESKSLASYGIEVIAG